MENYKKGKNVEEPLEKHKIPIANLPNDFLWMRVRGGSKIRNLVSHALSRFPHVENVVWTGIGAAIGKTISCAEIMKRHFENQLHQVTKIGYNQVDEYWDPLIPELDQLVVQREIPVIHILLSKQRVNGDDLGYQPPNSIVKYEKPEEDPQDSIDRKPARPT